MCDWKKCCHLSLEQCSFYPGWFGHKGNYTTQLYTDYTDSHKDPYTNQPGFHVIRVWNGSLIWWKFSGNFCNFRHEIHHVFSLENACGFHTGEQCYKITLTVWQSFTLINNRLDFPPFFPSTPWHLPQRAPLQHVIRSWSYPQRRNRFRKLHWLRLACWVLRKKYNKMFPKK